VVDFINILRTELTIVAEKPFQTTVSLHIAIQWHARPYAVLSKHAGLLS